MNFEPKSSLDSIILQLQRAWEGRRLRAFLFFRIQHSYSHKKPVLTCTTELLQPTSQRWKYANLADLALALRYTSMAFLESVTMIIVTDSKSAILQFTKGRLSRHAHSDGAARLSRRYYTTKTSFLWTPAQSSLFENEGAHNAARGIRADVSPSEPADFD